MLGTPSAIRNGGRGAVRPLLPSSPSLTVSVSAVFLWARESETADFRPRPLQPSRSQRRAQRRERPWRYRGISHAPAGNFPPGPLAQITVASANHTPDSHVGAQLEFPQPAAPNFGRHTLATGGNRPHSMQCWPTGTASRDLAGPGRACARRSRRVVRDAFNAVLAKHEGAHVNELLPVEDAARWLGIDAETLSRWIHERRLPTVKRGRVTSVRRSDLEAIARRGGPPPRRERRRGSVAQVVHRVQRCRHERYSRLSGGFYDALIRPAPVDESTPPFTAIPRPDRRRRGSRTERASSAR
jgi:excisionase family DNA binding protein